MRKTYSSQPASLQRLIPTQYFKFTNSPAVLPKKIFSSPNFVKKSGLKKVKNITEGTLESKFMHLDHFGIRVHNFIVCCIHLAHFGIKNVR